MTKRRCRQAASPFWSTTRPRPRLTSLPAPSYDRSCKVGERQRTGWPRADLDRGGRRLPAVRSTAMSAASGPRLPSWLPLPYELLCGNVPRERPRGLRPRRDRGRRPGRRMLRGLSRPAERALFYPTGRASCARRSYPAVRRPCPQAASLAAINAASFAARALAYFPPATVALSAASCLPAASSAGDRPRPLPRAAAGGRPLSPPSPSPRPPPRRCAPRTSARLPPAKGDVPSAGVARTRVRRREPAPFPSLLARRRGLVRRRVLHGGSAALSAEATFLADVHTMSSTACGLASTPAAPTASFAATSATTVPTAASSAGDCSSPPPLASSARPRPRRRRTGRDAPPRSSSRCCGLAIVPPQQPSRGRAAGRRPRPLPPRSQFRRRLSARSAFAVMAKSRPRRVLPPARDARAHPA